MAKPPRLSQLRVDQLRDIPEDVFPALAQVFYALNPFLQSTKEALTGKLGWENFKAIQKTVEVTTVPFVLSVAELSPSKPGMILVTQSQDLTLGQPSICPSLAWSLVNQNGKTAVLVSEASNYDSSHTYRWTFLVTAG
jgi:hypothetical protein